MRYHFALFTALAIPTLPAMADATAAAGACYSIQDSDLRALCLARAHKEPGQCYSIQRADLRAQCLAEVRGK